MVIFLHDKSFFPHYLYLNYNATVITQRKLLATFLNIMRNSTTSAPVGSLKFSYVSGTGYVNSELRIRIREANFITNDYTTDTKDSLTAQSTV